MNIYSGTASRLRRASSLGGRTFLLRLGLVPIAVGFCYLFDWHWLRALTADLTFRLTVLAVGGWTRVGPDLAMFRGQLFRIAIGCTLVDAWCGAVPLVWKMKAGILSNATYLAGLAAFSFGLNVSRLTLVNVIFSSGVPWHSVHDVASGLTYLVVWMLIHRRGAWRESSPQPISRGRLEHEGFVDDLYASPGCASQPEA